MIRWVAIHAGYKRELFPAAVPIWCNTPVPGLPRESSKFSVCRSKARKYKTISNRVCEARGNMATKEDKNAISPEVMDTEKALPAVKHIDTTLEKHSHDADEALKAFESGDIVEVDEQTNKRLLKIIDWHMMPLMCCVYGMNFLDSKKQLRTPSPTCIWD